MLTWTDAAWLAGVLETHGCFTNTSHGYPSFQFQTKHLHIARKVANILNAPSISTRHNRDWSPNPVYVVHLNRLSNLDLFPQVAGFMSPPRRADVIEWVTYHKEARC